MSEDQEESVERETVESTSDDRTRSNVMRHQYKVLNDEEKAQMLELKDRGLDFVELLATISRSAYKGTADADINPLRLASRELSLAQTKMEEAVMWAVKHVTG